jgi:hypothetical protein
MQSVRNILKHLLGFFSNEFPWAGAVGGATGYAVVLYLNNKKSNNKNNK